MVIGLGFGGNKGLMEIGAGAGAGAWFVGGGGRGGDDSAGFAEAGNGFCDGGCCGVTFGADF